MSPKLSSSIWVLLLDSIGVSLVPQAFYMPHPVQFPGVLHPNSTRILVQTMMITSSELLLTAVFTSGAEEVSTNWCP